MRIFTLKNNKIGLILSLILLSTFTISCVKEKDFDFGRMAQNQYESEWAVPILNARYQLDDFALDTLDNVLTDPTNQFLSLIYNTGDIWSVNAEELITLTDETMNSTQTLPAPTSTPTEPWIATYSTQIDLDMNGYSVDSLLLKEGLFITAFNTNINHPTQVMITIPGAVDQNGAPLTSVTDMNDLSSGTASGSTTLNLNGYKLTLEPGNKLTVHYALKVAADGNPYTTPTYNIEANTQFKDLKYEYITGYFGQISKGLTDTATIRLFTNHFDSPDNELHFSKCKVHLFMKNSFGIPIQFKINKYVVFNGNNEREVVSPGYTIDGPFPTFGQFGQTISQHDTINLNPDALEIWPKHQSINATGTLNPSNNPAIKNFVRNDSRFSIDGQIEIPMEGRISKFSYKDTLEFCFDKIEEIDMMNFKLYVENSFPIDGMMQVYFTDTNYATIDSLITNPQESVFAASRVGSAPNYYTIANGTSSRNFILSHDRIERLSSTKFLIVKATLTSKPTGQNIRLYGNQYVSVSLGSRVKIKANY